MALRDSVSTSVTTTSTSARASGRRLRGGRSRNAARPAATEKASAIPSSLGLPNVPATRPCTDDVLTVPGDSPSTPASASAASSAPAATTASTSAGRTLGSSEAITAARTHSRAISDRPRNSPPHTPQPQTAAFTAVHAHSAAIAAMNSHAARGTRARGRGAKYQSTTSSVAASPSSARPTVKLVGISATPHTGGANAASRRTAPERR